MKKRWDAIITVAPAVCFVIAVLFGAASYSGLFVLGGVAVFLLVASFVLSLINALRYCIIINNNALLSQESKSFWILFAVLFPYIVPVIYRWIYMRKGGRKPK